MSCCLMGKLCLPVAHGRCPHGERTGHAMAKPGADSCDRAPSACRPGEAGLCEWALCAEMCASTQSKWQAAYVTPSLSLVGVFESTCSVACGHVQCTGRLASFLSTYLSACIYG